MTFFITDNKLAYAKPIVIRDKQYYACSKTVYVLYTGYVVQEYKNEHVSAGCRSKMRVDRDGVKDRDDYVVW